MPWVVKQYCQIINEDGNPVFDLPSEHNVVIKRFKRRWRAWLYCFCRAPNGYFAWKIEREEC